MTSQCAPCLTERLQAALRQAYQRGWTEIQFTSNRGDPNCPIRVSWHPGDGHGQDQHEEVLELVEQHGDCLAALGSEWDKWSEVPTDPCPISRSPILVLCELLESFPPIKERALIMKAKP